MHYNPKIIEILEKIFFVLVLFVLSGSLFPFSMDHFSTGGWDVVEANPSHYLWFVLGGIYSITGLLLLFRWKQALRVMRACPWIVALLLFACLSVLWSTIPELTMRRAVAFLGTNMIGFYLVTRFSFREALNLLLLAFVFVGIVSLIFVIFYPEYGINPAPHEGAWRGVFSQKQAAGIYFSLAFLVFLTNATLSYGVKLSLSLIGMVCCGFLVHKSESKTALILLLLISAAFLCFVFLLPKVRRTHALWLVAGFVIMARVLWGGYAMLNNYSVSPKKSSEITEAQPGSMYAETVEALGRDQTLTGRTIIWSEVLRKAIERPVAGYGYVGYVWPPHIGAPYAQIREEIHKKLNFYPNQSHNGYIHLVLALGGVGLVLLLLIVAKSTKDWILCAVTGGLEYRAMWAGLFLLWFLTVNITTTVIADQNLIYWPLLILAVVYLHQERTERRAVREAIQMTEQEA